jgi:hypothetical protein
MTYDNFLNFLDEFEEIKSFNGKIKYADQNLQRIGSGTGRVVYDIDGEKIFKIAKNVKGIAQNEAEEDAARHKDYDDIITNIYESANDDSWLIVEKAKKVNEKRIKELTGIPSLNDLYMYFRNFSSENHGGRKIFGLDANIENELNNNEFVQRLINFSTDYSQHTGDYCRPSTYGEVMREGSPSIVLTDYGLNDEVYDTYYNPERKQKYRLYELFDCADGNDDILSDISNVGNDQRHGMWAIMPYSVSDGTGVINEDFISFVLNRKKYPTRPLPSMPYIIDQFHECVNNLKETLNHVTEKKKFYNNLLALQEYLLSQRGYDRDLLTKEEYEINETEIPAKSGLSNKSSELLTPEYAQELANATVEKLNLNINAPEMIGKGAFGYAFELNNNEVLKITTDISEADSASKLIRAHPKYIADVYNLYKIVDTEKNDVTFYGIIQENIVNKPVNEFLKYDSIISKIMPNNMHFGDLLLYYLKPKRYDYNLIMDTAKKILTDKPEANVSQTDRKDVYNYLIGLLNIRNELFNLDIKSHDYIEPKNLGYKDGVLKYFDVGGYVAVEPHFDEKNIVYLPEGVDNLTEDYDKNTADIIANQIAIKMGYEKPRYIKSGIFGAAYNIGDDKVLKITKDKTEATENLKLIGKPLKYIAQPYNIFSITSKSLSGIPETYGIVLEKLITDPEIIRLHDRLNFAFKKILNTNIPDAIEHYLGIFTTPNINENKIKAYFKKNPKDEEFFYGLLRIAEEVQKYNVESTDYLNADNLGYKKSGALGFFDVGFGNYLVEPEGAEKVEIGEDGSSRYSFTNAVGQDNFPVYNQNDSSPVTDNNVPPTDEDLEYHHVDDATKDEYTMDERIKTFAPGSKSVEVKKKCRIGGLPDGTSVACNQGDIRNLNLKTIKEDRVKSYMPGAQAITVKKKCRLGGLPDGTSAQCNKGDMNNLILNKINEEISSNKYYRAIEKNMGKTIEFEPEGYYEAIDDEGNPVFKYDTFWVSDVPEVAASKSIGGAVMGLYSMFMQHRKNPTVFYVYEINEKPDVDISHWDMGDFALLQEVRYRRAVQGTYKGKVTITDDMKKRLNAFYEITGLDAYDEPDKESAEIVQDTDYDQYLAGVKDMVHENKSYTGKAYRVDTGFNNKGKTAGDVIRFEEYELGNIDDFLHITDEKLKELDNYPARDIVWVTKTLEDAKRYSNEKDFSDIEEFDINGEVIAEDGDGGYLILIKNDITEEIHPSEAANDSGAIKTVLSGKRDVGFAELNKDNIKKFEKNNIGIIPVRMTSQNSFMAIIYRNKEKAEKLHAIAKQHGGHLNDRTPDEAREIGKLLGYKEASIDEYIYRKYGNKPPVLPEINPDDYNDLSEQTIKDFEKLIEKDVKTKKLDKFLLYSEDDFTVYAVNGDGVRDSGFIEWVDGGHHYVDANDPPKDQKYAKHIPENEIWVDDVFIIKPNDLSAIILHEKLERHLMKFYGLTYENAHVKYANPAELMFRKRVKDGFGSKIADKIYNEFVKKFENRKKVKVNLEKEKKETTKPINESQIILNNINEAKLMMKII